MREENKKNLENDPKFKLKQNDIFCQYEVPFNLMQLFTDNMLDSKMDLELEIALNNILKKQKEKEENEKNKKENEEEESEEEGDEEDEKEGDEKKEKKEKKYMIHLRE